MPEPEQLTRGPGVPVVVTIILRLPSLWPFTSFGKIALSRKRTL